MKNNAQAHPHNKLQLLCQLDIHKRWQSLDDTRHCVLCEQTISGRAIRIVTTRRNQALRCPTRGCAGTPEEWVHPDNPLVSEAAWHDWVRLLNTLCDEENTRNKPVRRLAPHGLERH